MAQRLAAVTLQQTRRGLEDREFADRVFAVLCGAHAQRPGVVQQAHEQFAARLFGQRAVVGFDLRDRKQFGEHGLVLVAALAQVDGGEVEAEHLHRAHQRPQPGSDQRLRVVRTQRGFDDAQVGVELVAVQVRALRRDRVAQRLGAGQLVQRRGQA